MKPAFLAVLIVAAPSLLWLPLLAAPPDRYLPPWQEALEPSGTLPTWEELPATLPSARATVLSPDAWAQWFERLAATAPGQRTPPLGVSGSRPKMNMWSRLKSPWPNHAALFFYLEVEQPIQFVLYHGQSGLLIEYTGGPKGCWIAHTITRSDRQFAPTTRTITARDEGQLLRAAADPLQPFSLRYASGEIQLGQGTHVLLRAPLAGMPEDAYVVGDLAIRDLRLLRYRIPDAPAEPGTDPNTPTGPVTPPVLGYDPANWHTRPGDEHRLQTEADQSVVLRRNAEEPLACAWYEGTERHAIRRVVQLRVTHAEPGCGVMVADETGAAQAGLLWTSIENGTGTVVQPVSFDPQFSMRAASARDADTAMRAEGALWLRLLIGPGHLKWWMSTDGIHWARGNRPILLATAPLAHVGVFCLEGRTAGQMRVQFVEMLPSNLPSAVLPVAWHDPPLPDLAGQNIRRWLDQIQAMCPEHDETARSRWRMACAWKQWHRNCPDASGSDLLDSVLTEASSLNLDPGVYRRLLDLVAERMETWHDHDRAVRMAEHYENWALQAFEQQQSAPTALLQQAWEQSPLWVRYPIRPDFQRATRAEAYLLAMDGRWQDLERMTKHLQQQAGGVLPPPLPWAAALASHALRRTNRPAFDPMLPNWTHPLVEDWSAQVYPFVTDLEAILREGSAEEACELIADTTPLPEQGLAPLKSDPNLLVSQVGMIEKTWDQVPHVSQVMTQAFGPVAATRISQAMERGVAADVALATLQFPGTPASSRAYLWLGDHALANGNFQRALAYYQHRTAAADDTMHDTFIARQKLASALLGEPVTDEPLATVVLGTLQLTDAEFSRLLQAYTSAQRNVLPSALGKSDRPIERQDPALTPRAGGWLNRGALSEALEPSSPTLAPWDGVSEPDVDWYGRTTTMASDAQRVYINDRYLMSAYNMSDGRRIWVSTPPPGRAPRPLDWPLIPMRPLVTDRWIIARQLNLIGPVLRCLDKHSGGEVWTWQPEPDEHVVSDVISVGDQLLALVIRQQPNGLLQLQLVSWMMETGCLSHRQDLFRLSPTWWLRRTGQLTRSGDTLIGLAGGTVFHCDTLGRLRWVRRQVVVPWDQDGNALHQHHTQAVIDRGRVYVVQPGGGGVECLDAQHGHRRWRHVLPEITEWVGLVDGQAVVRSERGCVGLDADSGRWQWERLLPGVLQAHVHQDNRILAVRRQPNDVDRPAGGRRLQWISFQAGSGLDPRTLPELELHGDEPRLGPVMFHDGAGWAIVAPNGANGPRNLMKWEVRSE